MTALNHQSYGRLVFFVLHIFYFCLFRKCLIALLLLFVQRANNNVYQNRLQYFFSVANIDGVGGMPDFANPERKFFVTGFIGAGADFFVHSVFCRATGCA